LLNPKITTTLAACLERSSQALGRDISAPAAPGYACIFGDIGLFGATRQTRESRELPHKLINAF